VEIHPELIGVPTHPDFRITLSGGDIFYLEAVSVGQKPAVIAEDSRLKDVHRVIDQMQVTDFLLGVETFRIGPRPLGTKKLRKRLQAWLSGLDPAVVALGAQNTQLIGFERLPSFMWDDDGWKLVFQALPLKAEARGVPRHALGMMGPGEAQVVDNVTGLTRVLEHKYGRYGALDAPLVIAVQSNTLIPTKDYEVEEALYGRSNRRPTDPQLLETELFADGFWRTRPGWRRDDYPQVITVYGLAPWWVTSRTPRLWSTVEAGVNGPDQPSWLARVNLGAEAIPEDGADLAAHFGLDASHWAGDPDFEPI
jgi:hypothetical protein